MSSPGCPVVASPPAPERPERRWWLVAVAAGWGVLLAGAILWSVRNDPPTVAEQRDIGAALPLFEQVSGLVVAAADGPDRTVEIGALVFDRGCSITPVRSGVEALRDITVRVRDDQAPGTLESVAAALPAGWKAAVGHNAASTRYFLHADAGEFVGVDATTDDVDNALTLQVSTGCRPLSDGIDYDPAPFMPGPGETPDALLDAVAALRAATSPQAAGPASPDPSEPGWTAGAEVVCPGGRVARTLVVGGLAAPGDLGRALREVAGGVTVVRADAHEWAYRVGEVSVVVTESEGVAKASATVSCR
ncbi:hypothetical protein [Actinoplanes sp. NPDC051494]|uniref:hypothetical protein n=1 Tax=Actinoplanes sp. NPDC051494 TaxID=3363907 RepID=UPI003797FB03